MSGRTSLAFLLVVTAIGMASNAASPCKIGEDNGYGHDCFVPGQPLIPGACYLHIDGHLNSHADIITADRLRGQLSILIAKAEHTDLEHTTLLARAREEETALRLAVQDALHFWGLPAIPTTDPWPAYNVTLTNRRQKRQFLDVIAMGFSTAALAESSLALAQSQKNNYAIEKLKKGEAAFIREFTTFANKTIQEFNLLDLAFHVLENELFIKVDLDEIFRAAEIIRKYLTITPPFVNNLKRGFIHFSQDEVPEGLWDHLRQLVEGHRAWSPDRYGSTAHWNGERHIFTVPVPTSCREVHDRVQKGLIGPGTGTHVFYDVQAISAPTRPTVYIPVRRTVNGSKLSLDDLTPFKDLERYIEAIDTTPTAQDFLDATEETIAVVKAEIGDTAHGMVEWLQTLPKAAIDAILGSLGVGLPLLIGAIVIGVCFYFLRRHAATAAHNPNTSGELPLKNIGANGSNSTTQAYNQAKINISSS